MMSSSIVKIIKIGVSALIVFFIFFFAFWFLFHQKAKLSDIELSFWGLFDDSDVYQPLIEKFKKKYPNVDIVYKKFSFEDYERELLDALNKKSGPDIFMIHNSYLWRYKKFLQPLLADKTFTIDKIKSDFSPAVIKDLTDGKNIYSLPLYVSTLALFYNKEMFAKNLIGSPPQTWEEFLKYTELLKKIDENGNILQAGAAMGTSQNINRAVDILYLLMMQSNVTFYDKGLAIFSQDILTSSNKTFNPAESAVKFYTDFANPKKRVYTYNNNLDYSLDLFAKGKLGMMFNYSWHVNTIKTKNPALDFGIAPVPQIQNVKTPLTFANYWSLAVNNTSASKEIAWEFIKFLQQPDNLKAYLLATSNPTARKDLISWQIKEMPDVAVFASQILMADSFPRYDDVAYEKVFAKMIDDIVYEYYSVKTALEKAEAQINKILP